MKICPLCHSGEFNPPSSHIPCEAKNPDTRCSPCTALVELDIKIEEARQNLMDLTAMRQRLRMDTNREHDPFTTRLPVELSSKIFELCTFDDDAKVYFPKPMPFTQVCWNWRTISNSTPELWTSLRIQLNYSKEERWPNWKEVSLSWLRRCGDSLPLSISLHIGELADATGGYCNTVYYIVQKFSHCLKHLEIDTTAEVIQGLCSYFEGRINSPSLRIVCRGKELRHDFEGPLQFLPKNLYLDNVFFQRAGIELRNLTHVEMVNVSNRACVHLLTLATQMVSCVLHNIWWAGFLKTSPQPFGRQAFKLKELTIKNKRDFMTHYHILKVVNLPSLERLSVAYANVVAAALIDNVQRSESHLETLSISDIKSLESSELNDLLRTVGPSLRHLDLVACNWEADGAKLATGINASLNDLTSLASVTFGVSRGSWSHALQVFILFGLAMVATRLQSFLVTLRFDSGKSPLDPQTANFILDGDQQDENTTSSIGPTQAEAIISAMKNPLLSVRIDVAQERKEKRMDITDHVIDALTRLIKKT